MGRVQPHATRVVAGVAGATAGLFAVGTSVALLGGGPIVGVVAGAAIAKTTEKIIESGLMWLGRNAKGPYHATLRAWKGKAQLDRLQREFREACREYRKDCSHDEAMRLGSSLKADYCRRFPQWQEHFQ